MVEPEALVQQRLHLAPRAVAVGLAAHEHVRRERREAARDLPHVQVVDLHDVRQRDQRAADLLGVELRGCGLEEDPPGRPHQPPARADHQRRDRKRGDRVGALEAEDQDHARRQRRAEEPVEVGQDVLEAALDVEVRAVCARQLPGRHDVQDGAGNGHRQDQPGPHVRRLDEPVDRLEDDEAGDHQQRDAVGLRGEDLQASEAERERALGRARGELERQQREAERARVGEHVAGVGEQRERVGDDARGDLAGHHEQDQRQRAPQPLGVVRRSVRVEAVIVGHGPKIREAHPV